MIEYDNGKNNIEEKNIVNIIQKKVIGINVIMLHCKRITHHIVVYRCILKPTLHNFVKIQKVLD